MITYTRGETWKQFIRKKEKEKEKKKEMNS